MKVELSWAELLIAAHISAMRRIQNLRNGNPGRYGAPEGEGARELDVHACAAEMAVGKALNLYWAGNVGDYRARDVGGFIQVRSTQRDFGRLILHDRDADDDPFVLVYTALPQCVLRGWILAKDGKHAEYRDDPLATSRASRGPRTSCRIRRFGR